MDTRVRSIEPNYVYIYTERPKCYYISCHACMVTAMHGGDDDDDEREGYLRGCNC